MTEPASTPFFLSVVLPCLNEADTLGACIDAADQILQSRGIRSEIIVADNGSTDDSVSIAKTHGARVIVDPKRGYGRALLSGLRAATGDLILMMDSDGSYGADDIPQFIGAYEAGADFILGCRFASGGGTIQQGAMPLLHEYIGNPLFTWIMRTFFHLPFHDVHCGMRAIRKPLLQTINPVQLGMECALELLLQVHSKGARLAEVPITLHPDGRHSHGSHLHTFRDGWHMLQFLCSYRWKK